MELILDSNSVQNQAQRRADQAKHHSWQSHLGFSDTTVSLSEEVRGAIAQISTAEYTNKSTNDGGDEAETYFVWRHTVGCGICRGYVGGDGDDETNCH